MRETRDKWKSLDRKLVDDLNKVPLCDSAAGRVIAAVADAVSDAFNAQRQYYARWSDMFRAQELSLNKSQADSVGMRENVRTLLAQSRNELDEITRRKKELTSSTQKDAASKSLDRAVKALDGLARMYTESINQLSNLEATWDDNVKVSESARERVQALTREARVLEQSSVMEAFVWQSYYDARASRLKLQCVNGLELSPIPRGPEK